MSSSLIETLKSKPKSPFEYLKEAKQSYDGLLKEKLETIEHYLDSKLYHQFTLACVQLFDHGQISGDDMAKFVYSVIYPYQTKLNALTVCSIVENVVDLLDLDTALHLISLFEPRQSDIPDAILSTMIIKAKVYLNHDKLEEASELLLVQITELMNKRFSIAISVSSNYYWACVLLYRKKKNEPKKLYDSLLLYLAYTQLNTISSNILSDVAFDLCYCSLISPDTFYFGELRIQPALTTIESDPKRQWILHFVQAAIEGNLSAYETALNSFSKEVEATFTRNDQTLLGKKMVLLALLELAFEQPKDEFKLDFTQIATHCKIPLDKVERLVMKAMSLDLIRGKIDGTTNQVNLTWTRPRIIDMDRIGILRDRSYKWMNSINSLASQLEKAVNDLLTVWTDKTVHVTNQDDD